MLYKNTRYHSGIGRSPFKAMFGREPMFGLDSLNLPGEVFKDVETENDLLAALGHGAVPGSPAPPQ